MKLFLSICLALALVGCRKYNNTPDCIQSKIDEFKTSLVYGGASVKEYKFEDGLVYVFDAGDDIVDGAATVYDSDCNYIGFLGGLAGNFKINGKDFNSNAKYKRTLWHN
jgi:hypothetical protein